MTYQYATLLPSVRTVFGTGLVLVSAICLNRLKIPFEELCKSLTPPDKDDTDVDSPNIMRRLLFCDFSEAKSEDRFYKEINDMNKVGKGGF